ncbi:ninjurin-2-like [Chrysoperla carnea]|uniref:ninjurin-2-like n=1 Tax=Chrysoperla carnea TaxID=189513 RepID=UPI001D08A606|nr:ninjurin-2-like [Chrysoperla carnea]
MAELNADNEKILKRDSTEIIKIGIDNSDNVSLEETTGTELIEENKQSKETLGENLENPLEIESQVDSADGRRRNKINNNTYVAKKTAAQGLMDIALLTANANQLRYIIEYSSSNLTFAINITLICISLLLQIFVGITLAFQGRFYYRGESKKKSCKNLKNYIIIGVFLITLVNVFIASFTQIVPRDQIIAANSKSK